MAKNKILFHSGLYNLKMYQGERRYRIIPANDEIFKKIVETESNELICNFDEKKDHRNENSKNSNYLCLDFQDLFFRTTPKADFSFVQNPASNSKWDIKHGYYWGSNEQNKPLPQVDNTFTFTGKINSITLNKNGNFKTLTFNQTAPIEKTRYDDIVYTDIRLNSQEVKKLNLNNFAAINLEIEQPSQIEELSINGCQKMLISRLYSDSIKNIEIGGSSSTRIEALRSKSLNKLKIKPCDCVDLDINNWRVPKIKEIDLTDAKWIKMFKSISDVNCIFKSLNLDFSSSGYSWEEEKPNIFRNFQDEYKRLLDEFNPNCKILLNPESIISSAFLPKRKEILGSNLTEDKDILSKSYKVKEIFKPNSQGKYEITVLDLAKIFYINKKQDVQKQIKDMDVVISNLDKFDQQIKQKIKQDPQKIK